MQCKYIQHKHLTVYYLEDGPTDTHTLTHPKEVVVDAFISAFSSEDSGAESQGLPWTCPPRVVFRMTRFGARPGHQNLDSVPYGDGTQPFQLRRRVVFHKLDLSGGGGGRRSRQWHGQSRPSETSAPATRALQHDERSSKVSAPSSLLPWKLLPVPSTLSRSLGPLAYYFGARGAHYSVLTFPSHAPSGQFYSCTPPNGYLAFTRHQQQNDLH